MLLIHRFVEGFFSLNVDVGFVVVYVRDQLLRSIILYGCLLY